MEKLEGHTLAKYRLLREIGSSDMSTVYLGHDPFIDRPVAIKIANSSRPDARYEPEVYRQLFFNEAQAAGLLKHPNITAVYDAGVDGEHYYIVMEYVHGEQTLEHYCRPENLLPLEVAIGILYQCAMALDYAHRKGVVHRDIKPGNILLNQKMEVKLSDFGIAQIQGQPLDQSLSHIGSPLYMSPEQIDHGEITSRSDLFSLGVVAYEMLTGKHPFAGENLDAIRHNILSRRPVPLSELRSDIPELLDRIIERALAKEPERRYASGLDLGGDLSLVFDFLGEAQEELDQQEKYQALRAMEFFSDFNDSELWELINASQWLRVPEGEEIIAEGDVDRSFYIVVSGVVQVSKQGVRLDLLGEGECFGEMGFISGAGRSATITARQPVTVMKLRASQIERASVMCQLQFHKRFLTALINRLSRADDRIVQEQTADETLP